MAEISEADATPRLKSLWRERVPLAKAHEAARDTWQQFGEQLRKHDEKIEEEKAWIVQHNNPQATGDG